MSFNDVPNKPNYDNNHSNRFETGMGPMTDRILGTVLDKITSGDFREVLTDKIVDPVTEIINKKIKPYVYISLGLYTILVIFLIIIIYLLIKKKK